MTVKVIERPDFKVAKRLLREALAETLLYGADQVKKDTQRRINARIKLDDSQQTSNQPQTLRRKRAKLGHGIPLLGEEAILSNPAEYLVNGSTIPPTAQQLSAGTGRMVLKVELPPARKDIVLYLESPTRPWGTYDVPFGISAPVKRNILGRAQLEVRRALRRFAGRKGKRGRR